MITIFQKWVYKGMGGIFSLRFKKLSERAAKRTTSTKAIIRFPFLNTFLKSYERFNRLYFWGINSQILGPKYNVDSEPL